jgi:steroid delta-isomerase-like uncharacterized protein
MPAAASPAPTANPVHLSRAYFEAWNRHDRAAVQATLAPGGHYRDPFTPAPLAGAELAGYAQALFDGLPDVRFDYEGPFPLDGQRVLVPWVLTGTHRAPFNGIPASGRTLRLEGVDLLTAGDGGLLSVVGHFDSAAFLRQLGLVLVPQPG